MRSHCILAAIFSMLLATTIAVAAAPAEPGAVDDKQMALSPRWMPEKVTGAEKMLKAMEFYARAALGGAEPGRETVPSKVLSGAGWDLDWLMPLKDAEKKLPPRTRAQMGGATALNQLCWPQNSIFVKSYQGEFLVPGYNLPPPPVRTSNGVEVFTEMHLICDLKQRLIGVQFNTDQRKWLKWDAVPGEKFPKIEKLNPYYDFRVMGANAVANRVVEYQIVRSGPVVAPGMACIHTYLPPLPSQTGSFLGNVRWYLAAPLARKLVEIAERHRDSIQSVK